MSHVARDFFFHVLVQGEINRSTLKRDDLKENSQSISDKWREFSHYRLHLLRMDQGMRM